MKLLCLLPLLLLVGCWKTEASEIQHEDAVVVSKKYVPAHTDISLSYDGDDFSIDTDSVPDEWTVVFSCQHGRFSIDGERGEPAQQVFDSMHPKAKVDVAFREVFWVEEKKNGEKKKTHKDFWFVSATPK